MQDRRDWQDLPTARAGACLTWVVKRNGQDLVAQQTEEVKWMQGVELVALVWFLIMISCMYIFHYNKSGRVDQKDTSLYKDRHIIQYSCFEARSL